MERGALLENLAKMVLQVLQDRRGCLAQLAPRGLEDFLETGA